MYFGHRPDIFVIGRWTLKKTYREVKAQAPTDRLCHLAWPVISAIFILTVHTAQSKKNPLY